jgi:predicted dehydrogenase
MSQPQDPTRRDVVKLAGAASVAAAASRLQGAPAIQKVKAANDQVPFGIIGTGSRGSYLLKHLNGIDNGRCVALCDIDDESLKKGLSTTKEKPKAYKDYRELLADKNVEAVIIAVPLYMHFPITRDSLLAGKHTFCEKSLVFKPEEVHALRALAKEHPKQVLQVGLQRRYSKYYQAVKDMVDKGLLGDVTHVQAQWHRNPGWVMKPASDPQKTRLKNWRLFREYSGGLAAELASHQTDVADWMFGAEPEFVTGVGGLDYWKDGRDIYDNIALIYQYPKGRKMIYHAISTNSHLPFFGGTRTEMGECIMGTAGCVEITVGFDEPGQHCIAIWYSEPAKPKVEKAPAAKEFKAGATMIAAAGTKGIPLAMKMPENMVTGKESFLEKELKFGRQWLYSKGILMPEEDTNPVDTELQSFFNDTKTGGRPRADVEVGLADSTSVILSNLAMDENRRVYFSEIEKMGRNGTGVRT